MSFIQNGILLKTFVESQFQIKQLYQFQTKPNSDESICWVSLWSYVSLWVSNQSEFAWRYLLSLSLKLFKITSFKQNLILMNTFVESQFEVMSVYEFQTKANSHEDICWVSVWSYLCFWVSKNSEFSWRYLLSLSLKLFKLTSFKQNRILMNTFLSLILKLCKLMSFKQNRTLIKTFVESHFEIM